MAYDNNTGLLHVNPSTETFETILDNIAKALGDYRTTNVSGVVARDLGSLCTSPKINKWSKNKPFRRANFVGIPTDDMRIYANYGLNIPIINGRASELEALYKKEDCGWEYLAPRGIAYNEFYRASDFDKYLHKAPNPFTKVIAPVNVSIKYSKDIEVTMMMTPPESTGYSIDINSLSVVKDMYFGFQLINGSTSRTHTATTPIKQNGISATLPVTGIPLGTYKLIPFLSASQYNNNSSDIVGTFLTIPTGKIFNLNVNNKDAYTLIVQAKKGILAPSGISGTVEYNFDFENVALESSKIENNELRVRYANKTWDDMMTADEVSITLPNFDVPKGTSMNYKEWEDAGQPLPSLRWPSISVPKSLFNSSMKVMVSLGGGRFMSSATPIDSTPAVE